MSATETDDPTLSDTDALTALAHLHDTRRWPEAVELAEAWLQSRGTFPPLAAMFYSAALQGTAQYDEAVRWGAIAAHTLEAGKVSTQTFISSRVNLAQALARTGDLATAMQLYRACLKVTPENAADRTAMGHLRLSIKPHQWKRGWADHEARIGTDRAPVIPGVPEWDGGPTDGPVVVLHEQGIGDAILFARYLPLVSQRSGHPVLWAGPANLHRWIRGIAGVQDAIGVEEALLERDGEAVKLVRGSCIVRAMSLAHYCGTTFDGVPSPVAPDDMALYRQRVWGLHHSKPPVRVGVCWQGAAAGHHDFERTIPPETFNLLWEPPIPNVEYVSLQYNTPAPDGAPFGHGNDGDVLTSAERIASCDLVVSVDTSTVHLAGSLGVPTLCLTPSVPDWRYPKWPHGTDTPWYPSVQVVRRDRADAAADQVRTARALVEAFVERVTT